MAKTGNDQSWHVYLLECADGTYYCGAATDMARRLEQHNGLLPGGAKYTRTRRPVKLLASRACDDKSGACRLEYAVKAAPREKKLDVLLSR
ncbi:MAG: GIY-YIG nuclease family protein [Desulfovibrio sp.]|jgi:putative endonuclease|nr:GIY-YIG nuclease family protein [Desulfovibrio sp.]